MDWCIVRASHYFFNLQLGITSYSTEWVLVQLSQAICLCSWSTNYQLRHLYPPINLELSTSGIPPLQNFEAIQGSKLSHKTLYIYSRILNSQLHNEATALISLTLWARAPLDKITYQPSFPLQLQGVGAWKSAQQHSQAQLASPKISKFKEELGSWFEGVL